MKRSFRFLAIVIAIAITSLVTACGGKPAPKEQEEMTLNWGLTPSPNSGDAESARELAELIHKYTNGKITVEVFPGATLGGEKIMLEGLLSGTVDMANVSPNIVATIAPEMNAICLPFLYNSLESAVDSFADPQYIEKVNGILEKYGLIYLGWSYVCPRSISIKREIRVPSDVKGEVIRVMDGSIYSDMYAAWGFGSTVIAWGECYTAVQQGVCDGIDAGNEPNIDMAFYEVTSHALQTDHVYHAQMTLMSLEKWNSLTQETRDVIMKAEQENMNVWAKKSLTHFLEDTAAVQNEPYNMKLIFLTDEERAQWVEASKPVYEKYKSVIGEDFYNWMLEYAKEKNAKYD